MPNEMYAYYGVAMPEVVVTAMPAADFDLAGLGHAGCGADHAARRGRPDRSGRPLLHGAAHAWAYCGLGLPVRRARRHAVHRGRALRRREAQLGRRRRDGGLTRSGCAASTRGSSSRATSGPSTARSCATRPSMECAARRLRRRAAQSRCRSRSGSLKTHPRSSAEAVGPKRSPATRAGRPGWVVEPRAGEESLDYHVQVSAPRPRTWSEETTVLARRGLARYPRAPWPNASQCCPTGSSTP